MTLDRRLLLAAATSVFFLAAPPANAKRSLSECDAAAQITAEISEALTVCGAFPDEKRRLEAVVLSPRVVAIINLAEPCIIASLKGGEDVNATRGRLAFLRAVESAGAKKACDVFIEELQ